MDHRCPDCRANLERRKLSQAVMAGMEIDCPGCRKKIRFNVHGVEQIVVFLNFGAIVALGVLAYRFESKDLVLVTLGVAMIGPLALPLLERTWLRTWPRYESTAHRDPGPRVAAPVPETPSHTTKGREDP